MRRTLSVIVPNYNHARYLPACLDALLAQSRLPDEILILDDASTDDSWAILDGYARVYPGLIRVMRNDSNLGVNATWNQLVELAQGEYVYGAGADDLTLPDLLEQSMALLERHPEAGLCSSLSRTIDGDGQDHGVFPSPMPVRQACYLAPEEVASYLVRVGSWIKGNTVVYRRQAVLNVGGLDGRLGAYSDAFMQMIIARRWGACFIPRAMARFRQTYSGYSLRSVSRFDVANRTTEVVRQKMAASYSELFDKAFIAMWSKRLIWSYRVSAWYAIQNLQRDYVHQTAKDRVGSLESTIARMVRRFLELSTRIQLFAIMLYWGVRQGVMSWLIKRWWKRAR